MKRKQPEACTPLSGSFDPPEGALALPAQSGVVTPDTPKGANERCGADFVCFRERRRPFKPSACGRVCAQSGGSLRTHMSSFGGSIRGSDASRLPTQSGPPPPMPPGRTQGSDRPRSASFCFIRSRRHARRERVAPSSAHTGRGNISFGQRTDRNPSGLQARAVAQCVEKMRSRVSTPASGSRPKTEGFQASAVSPVFRRGKPQSGVTTRRMSSVPSIAAFSPLSPHIQSGSPGFFIGRKIIEKSRSLSAPAYSFESISRRSRPPRATRSRRSGRPVRPSGFRHARRRCPSSLRPAP